MYAGFYPETLKTITEALKFVQSKIEEYRVDILTTLDPIHHDVINAEMKGEIARIERIKDFLIEKGDSIYPMSATGHSEMMNVIRSSLEVYLREIMKVKSKLDLPTYDKKVIEINRIINLESLKDAKTDLYDRYYPPPATSPEGKKIEFFFSYSSDDKLLAGKIRTLLVDQKEVDVFLAHHDIPISKEWREEIFRHLESCNVLLALITPNFEKSVWANQEAGYIYGKGKKVIPLIVKGTDIRRFGFLEALQGVQIKEENLSDCVEKILKIVLA